MHQIRRLFHGHVSCDRIDAALEQLMLIDAAGTVTASQPEAAPPLSGRPPRSNRRKKTKYRKPI